MTVLEFAWFCILCLFLSSCLASRDLHALPVWHHFTSLLLLSTTTRSLSSLWWHHLPAPPHRPLSNNLVSSVLYIFWIVSSCLACGLLPLPTQHHVPSFLFLPSIMWHSSFSYPASRALLPFPFYFQCSTFPIASVFFFFFPFWVLQMPSSLGLTLGVRSFWECIFPIYVHSMPLFFQASVQ